MKKTTILFLFLFAVLFPISAFAVDFEISEVTIDAKLQPNGDANVIEKHTYVFDSKFKGVTRELIAKEGAAIANFKAYENGKALKVEHKKGEYKIFRSGKKETIEVEMHYRIVNGVEKYEDGAQFYWPFFDKRNETDYRSMQIEVHPPSEAKDVLFLGYDTAYKKGMIASEGTVAFVMGKVPSGKNGDVRVVYEPELFPDVTARKGTIQDELIAEETRLADKEAAYIVGRVNVANYGLWTMTGFGVFLFSLIGWTTASSRRKKREAKELVEANGFSVPAEKLSIPATIHYTTSEGFSTEATSAALLDLIRKGHVEQVSDEQFELVNREVAYSHEKELIELLFDKIGNGKKFKLTNLEVYTKNENNHVSYNAALLKWRGGIVEEVKSKGLYERQVGLRWAVALISVAMIVVAVQFAHYELFPYMALTIILVIGGLLFATFYKSRNQEGHLLFQEWRRFKEEFKELDLDEWKRLSTDDKFRAYTYSIGCGDKSFGKHFTKSSEVEKHMTNDSSGFFYYNPVTMNTSFTSANTETSGSSSTYSGGTGGGGGGSGAF
ncbi:DUF2207 domain-containing protein [Sporosarcina sp. G11-34]|uniref:DUF2207 domain-containing protein n=1 Tax=Sporosarcina sp. G11-34 TaxID=2849605 RepID=UPI0022A8D4E5|nr:DUF2207 domain-containing protein [Sporosarcina sp. G11-34]MCZ2259935.1 DUF2207 domain-containing protein [Sporosarcina sp. G11-34]